MARVFFSHSSVDNHRATALKQWLIDAEPVLAHEVFLDVDPETGIRTGVRWKEALQQAAERCEAVVCLISADWVESAECRSEMRTAEYLHKRIFCARLEPVPLPHGTDEWQYCDLFGGPHTTIRLAGTDRTVAFLTEGLERLRHGLIDMGIGADHFPWPPPTDPQRAPYRGWKPLEAVDAAVFFGRDPEIVRSLDTLRGMRATGVKKVLVLLGPSGAGKSSFLRAGLLPRLHHRDDQHFHALPIVRPSRHVLTGTTGLASALHSTREDLGFSTPKLGQMKTESWLNFDNVRDWLIEIQRKAHNRFLGKLASAEAPTLVLPIDQAEELFTPDGGAEAPYFMALLGKLLTDALGPSIIVVLTLRADRFEALQNTPEFTGVGLEVFDALRPLHPPQFKEVITGPALRQTQGGRKLELDPELVQALLIDCAHGADTLPLLALTLSRLYEDYGTSGSIAAAEYETMGGIRRVIENEVDDVLATDPDQRATQLHILQRAFVPWLATINPVNDQPMRRVADYADLPPDSLQLIEALVEKRLLVKDERDGRTVVEVAIESFLWQWPPLAAWLRVETWRLKTADNLERGAEDWEVSGRNDAWLLEGDRLRAAESLYDDPGFQRRLLPRREYLAASRHRERSRARRITALAAVVVALAVAAMAATSYLVMANALYRDIDAELRLRSSVLIENNFEAFDFRSIALGTSYSKDISVALIFPDLSVYTPPGSDVPIGEGEMAVARGERAASLHTVGDQRVHAERTNSGSTLVIAQRISSTRAHINRLGMAELGVGVVGVLLAAAAGAAMARIGLRPITRGKTHHRRDPSTASGLPSSPKPPTAYQP